MKFRRAMAIVLALTLAGGFVVNDAQAARLDSKAAVATTAEMPACGHCDGCADEGNAMTPAACAACCASMVALPVSIAADHAIVADRPEGFFEPAMAGRVDPPDPYPPRSTSLT